jgi:deazaflavin-dependent oxidoreductase (nitroreductase family)
MQRLAAIAWVTRLVAPVVQVVDRALLACSGDRTSLTALAIGLPVRLVSTTGARSGRLRRHPLTIVPEGSGFAVIASNFGRPRLPAWSHNLRAHPDVEVRLGGRMRPFRAREVEGELRLALWQTAVELYPGYAAYAARAAPRPIPIFLLMPGGEAGE